VNRQTRSLHGLSETLKTIGVWGEAEVPDDHGDALVTELDQVVRCLGTRVDVVGAHCRDWQAAWNSVYEYRREAPAHDALIDRGFGGTGDQNTVDATCEECRKVPVFAPRVFVGVAENDCIAFLLGGGLDAPHDFREKRVRDIGQDHADYIGTPDLETASDLVRLIIESSHRVADALHQTLADYRCAVDYSRNGRRGSARETSDIADRRPPLSTHSADYSELESRSKRFE
jgi:hypothetical protein